MLVAYLIFSFRYRSKLGSALRSTDVMKVLSNSTGFIHAERVVETLKNFIASSRDFITTEDVTRSKFTSNDKEKEKHYCSDEYKSVSVHV
jgi:hypothetical protein